MAPAATLLGVCACHAGYATATWTEEFQLASLANRKSGSRLQSLSRGDLQPLLPELCGSVRRKNFWGRGGERGVQLGSRHWRSRWPGGRQRSCQASWGGMQGGGQVSHSQRPYTAVMIVPTGVGASIGGFAGDALPVARAMAASVDCLITHPNVLNGAMMYWPMANTLYVEGYGLDQFASGEWGLLPVHQNRVGLVLDGGMEEELLQRHLQVADAARATLGLPVIEYTITDAPLQVEKWIDPATGASTGRLGRADSLMRAVATLVSSCQVDAVAVVARFPDDSLEEIEDYRQGQGVDALAGVEAVISHMVVSRFRIPCAHAPALPPLPLDPSISPRSSAEEIGYTFLPCVLAGLSKAPQFLPRQQLLEPVPHPWRTPGGLWAHDVDCVVVPATACGGPGVLAFGRMTGKGPLIVAVEENATVLDQTPESLSLPVLRVKNYWEAIGVVAAHKAGVDPFALRRDGVGHISRAGPVKPPNGVAVPQDLAAQYETLASSSSSL